MKKIILSILILLVVLAVLAAVALHVFLDGAVKRGVETVGPDVTKVSVKLDTVNISLLSGSGKIHGLVIGNPEGYKSPSAISVGKASLALRAATLLSDKVVINSIEMHAPEITLETDVLHNNLSKILANLDETTGGGKEPAPSKEPGKARKLQVDDFLIEGGKVHVLLNAMGTEKAAVVSLPEIHLKDLGKGPEGITPVGLSREVLKTILVKASEAAAGAIADLSKNAVFLSSEPGKAATNTVDKVTKGIGDLLKKR